MCGLVECYILLFVGSVVCGVPLCTSFCCMWGSVVCVCVCGLVECYFQLFTGSVVCVCGVVECYFLLCVCEVVDVCGGFAVCVGLLCVQVCCVLWGGL